MQLHGSISITALGSPYEDTDPLIIWELMESQIPNFQATVIAAACTIGAAEVQVATKNLWLQEVFNLHLA